MTITYFYVSTCHIFQHIVAFLPFKNRHRESNNVEHTILSMCYFENSMMLNIILQIDICFTQKFMNYGKQEISKKKKWSFKG